MPQFDIDSPYPLSAEQIEFYRANGYVKLKRVLSPEVIEHYRRIISQKVQELNTLHLPMEQRTVYEKAFLQIMNLWTKSEEVKQFVMGKRLARIAAELMGCRGVRMYHDQALYKEAGGGITPWHADQYYWPVSSDKTVTTWIPLQDTPLEMGPLAFAPGSFRIETGRDLEISDESERKLQRSLKSYPIHEDPFELGEVSFHSGWTFHRAGANATDRPREVMTIIYVDQDIRLLEPKNKDQKNDRERWCPGVAVGDVLNSPLNPVIYSEVR
ncbi:MAG: phytanoyl-CoA dioxygenase family protein [Acidobacteriaceae bacterium]|nr:phytanoyl-CoA dioxygenase family protein [Acidobacteriaceae bacterium]MBV9307566.1 phytanoyl-CoA dioxygenase family protein [Acidobacteriaceae bacterium]